MSAIPDPQRETPEGESLRRLRALRTAIYVARGHSAWAREIDEVMALLAAPAPVEGAPDVERTLAKIKQAEALISDLNHGRRQWSMSIPAQRNYDPDLVIGDALHWAAGLLARGQVGEAVTPASGMTPAALVQRADEAVKILRAARSGTEEYQEVNLGVSGINWWRVERDIRRVVVGCVHGSNSRCECWGEVL